MAARNQDGRIELFVLNSLHNVFHRYQVTPNGGLWVIEQAHWRRRAFEATLIATPAGP